MSIEQTCEELKELHLELQAMREEGKLWRAKMDGWWDRIASQRNARKIVREIEEENLNASLCALEIDQKNREYAVQCGMGFVWVRG